MTVEIIKKERDGWFILIWVFILDYILDFDLMVKLTYRNCLRMRREAQKMLRCSHLLFDTGSHQSPVD